MGLSADRSTARLNAKTLRLPGSQGSAGFVAPVVAQPPRSSSTQHAANDLIAVAGRTVIRVSRPVGSVVATAILPCPGLTRRAAAAARRAPSGHVPLARPRAAP